MKAPVIRSMIIGIVACAGTVLAQTTPDNLGTPAPIPAAAGDQNVAQPATGKPQLVFENMEHEFGRIPDTTAVDAEFKFTNKGDAPLKFTLPLKASCGCTAGNPRSPKNPNVDQAEFGPGESGFIKVTYNPQGKHGDVNQRVTCLTNDPQQPEQILKIHAFVRTTIAFDPPLVSFGEVQTGESRSQVVKVNGPAPDFKVDYASVSKGRYITVKVLDTKPVTIDGEQMNQSTLELTFNGAAPRGSLQAVTTVRTNNEKYPLADLQVMAEVVGDIQVLPPRVNVGIVESNQAFTKVFRVNSRSGKPFKITKVDQKTNLASPLVITVTPAEAGVESSYQVEVKGAAPATPTPITATITIATDKSSEQVIEVQLNGAVRPPAPATAIQPLSPDNSPAGPGAKPPTPASDTPR